MHYAGLGTLGKMRLLLDVWRSLRPDERAPFLTPAVVGVLAGINLLTSFEVWIPDAAFIALALAFYGSFFRGGTRRPLLAIPNRLIRWWPWVFMGAVFFVIDCSNLAGNPGAQTGFVVSIIATAGLWLSGRRHRRRNL